MTGVLEYCTSVHLTRKCKFDFDQTYSSSSYRCGDNSRQAYNMMECHQYFLTASSSVKVTAHVCIIVISLIQYSLAKRSDVSKLIVGKVSNNLANTYIKFMCLFARRVIIDNWTQNLPIPCSLIDIQVISKRRPKPKNVLYT